MTKYVVRLFGDAQMGYLECEANSPEDAVSIALDPDVQGIDWQSVEDGNEPYAVEVYDAPDADAIHEWTTETERLRRASYYLIPFLGETVSVLPEGEPKRRLMAFFAYIKGQGTWSDILPLPAGEQK